MILAGMLSIGYVSAQEHDGKVGINIVEPKATLEVESYKNDGTTKEGILIPRLAKQVVVKMKALKPEESTLVYVTDEVATADAADFVGTGKGFYFYDTATSKWTKLGAGESAATAETGAIVRNIRSFANSAGLLETDWTDDDYTIVLTSGFAGSVGLPKPSENKGRVVNLRNLSGANRNYAPYTPVNNATINTNRGHVLHCDGTNWHVIGGF